MKTLDKHATTTKAEHQVAIQDAADKLEAAVDKFNAALANERDAVTAALENLNEKISDADAWREEINGDQESYYEDRSEKWQEGDAGQAYNGWKEQWGQSLEQVTIELPDELEMPGIDALATLEELSESVE